MKLYKYIIDGITLFSAYTVGVIIITFHGPANALCVGFVLGVISGMICLVFNINDQK